MQQFYFSECSFKLLICYRPPSAQTNPEQIFFFYYSVLEECLPAIKRPQTEECCVIGCKYYLWYCLPAINPLQRFWLSSPRLCLIRFLSCFEAVHQFYVQDYCYVCQQVCYSSGRRCTCAFKCIFLGLGQ